MDTQPEVSTKDGPTGPKVCYEGPQDCPAASAPNVVQTLFGKTQSNDFIWRGNSTLPRYRRLVDLVAYVEVGAVDSGTTAIDAHRFLIGPDQIAPLAQEEDTVLRGIEARHRRRGIAQIQDCTVCRL